MRSICFYFQVHQPFRLRTYRFFEMGQDHYYYDDYQNRHNIRELAKKCYLPANNAMMELIEKHGNNFRISYSISGTTLELFERYAPEVIESFRQLIETKNVELVAEPYSHSLTGLRNKDEFVRQINQHTKTIKEMFGVVPKTFCNTELIYSDDLGVDVAELGFTAMLTEGAKHILGWKSPNYLYCNTLNPNLKVLMRNVPMSEDIELRFGDTSWDNWPLTAEKFTHWLHRIEKEQPILNLFFPYEVFGEYQDRNTGIFEFMKALPEHVLNNTDYLFRTPQDIIKSVESASSVNVLYPISWFDEERDTTAWLGNEMQHEAINSLYNISNEIVNCNDEAIKNDWNNLQSVDNLAYMSTKWVTGISNIRMRNNYYPSAYDAFINYMNILSDIMIRVENCVEREKENSKKDNR